MKVLLLLCAFGVVFSQVPSPCNSPAQWEGREIKEEKEFYSSKKLSEGAIAFMHSFNKRLNIFQTSYDGLDGRVYYDFKMQYEEKRRMFYDELNRRSRTFAEVEIGSNKTFYDHLHLYNENKNYTINLKEKTCALSPIQHPWRYRGVHPDARFEFTATLGGTGIPGESITIQLFSANETNAVYTGMVTYPGCLPVGHSYYSQMYGVEHNEYYDITLGISDPEVFVPPEECRGLTL